MGQLGFCTSWAADKHGREKQWLEIVELDLPLKNFSSSFAGKKIVHVSDLHCSRTVSAKYLSNCINRINSLQPDIVVLTGDYITHDFTGKYRHKVVEIIGKLQTPLGVYACLGNHDYGFAPAQRTTRRQKLHNMIEHMQSRDIKLLRNKAAVLHEGSSTLQIVGLGDLWAKDFNPEKAFKNVHKNETIIALTHNPKSVDHLKQYDFDAARI